MCASKIFQNIIRLIKNLQKRRKMMKPYSFTSYKEQIDQDFLNKAYHAVQHEIDTLKQALPQEYNSPYASLWVGFDTALQQKIYTVYAQKKVDDIAVVLVIGIGGSSLGIRALVQLLSGSYYNERTTGIKFYCLETVDNDEIVAVYHLIEKLLRDNKKVLINVITKSGTTTETIVNFEIFVSLMQQYHPTTYHDYIVVTTDAQSPLWYLAKEQKWSCIEIPARVGGRFSTFVVAQLPLLLLGYTLDPLLQGLRDSVQVMTTQAGANDAALYAILMWYYYQQGYLIHDYFTFTVDAHALGLWYRQIIAESVGKKSVQGALVGMTPTVSIGTTDLHSVGQLNLGGPYDKFFTFVTFGSGQPPCTVPCMPLFERCVAHIQQRPVDNIMDAIVHGVQRAYQQDKRPFCSFVIPDKSLYSLGYYMQMHMISVMYLGYLLEINPFDQPHVELYKKETRALLASHAVQ